MSLTVTKRPDLYTAARVPFVYKMQRKDYSWNALDNNSGKARITFTGVNIVSSFSNGDVIYLKSNDGKYDITTTVTNSTLSGSDTKVTTDATYSANATNGFVNNLTKRALHQVLVNLYDPVTNTALFEDGFQFSSDSKGVALIDVQFVKQLLLPEIVSVASFGSAMRDVRKFVAFYIGYTELWVGSAEAEVLDTSNVRYSIYGTLPISGKNDYIGRIKSRVLSVTDNLRAYFGKYFDLTYFGLSSSTNIIKVEHYDSAGNLTATDADLTAVTGVFRSSIIPLSTDKSILAKVIGQFLILDGTLWTNQSGLLAFTKAASTLSASMTANQGYGAEQPSTGIDLSNFTPITISLQISGTWTGTVTMTVFVDDEAQNYRAGSVSGITANGTYPLTIQPSSTSGFGLGAIGKVRISIATGAGNTGTANVVITIPNGQVVQTPISTQTIEVKEACVRPITLSWANRLGGQDWWTFTYSQEFTYAYDNNTKSRRIMLHADDLSYSQWQMLNGLNEVGDTYDKGFIELSYSVMGTQKRFGSQAYILLDDLGLLEVVVIPSVISTKSKRERHSFDVMVELPDGYEENNFFLEFTGRTKRLISQLIVTTAQPNTPSIEWEVDWFGHIPVSLKSSDIANLSATGPSITIVQQLPQEPTDLVIRVRKISNGGIAQANGSITFAKDAVAYAPLTKNFSAGDDVSDLVFVMPGIDASAAFPNDRINVTVTEQV